MRHACPETPRGFGVQARPKTPHFCAGFFDFESGTGKNAGQRFSQEKPHIPNQQTYVEV
jgi:hypothetical protein